MLRSIQLQSMATRTRQEIALIISALYEATNVTPMDYDHLETHVCAAIGILEANEERLTELERALGECHCAEGAEGVAQC